MTTATTGKTTDAAEQFAQHLRQIGACTEARDWAKGKTAQQAWDDCDRTDWLLWWIARDKLEAKREIVRVACKIARLVLYLVPEGEERPRLAIEAAEKWADDPTEENLEKVRIARRAAYAAAALAAAADAVYAVYAAYAAADAAADAVYAAAAADAAAGKQIKAQSLAIIRAQFTCPWSAE